MTLEDLRRILFKTRYSMYGIGFFPDAICMSRNLYEQLMADIETYKVVKLFADEKKNLSHMMIFGLTIFVNDKMPDNYYCIGTREMFLPDCDANLIT